MDRIGLAWPDVKEIFSRLSGLAFVTFLFPSLIVGELIHYYVPQRLAGLVNPFVSIFSTLSSINSYYPPIARLVWVSVRAFSALAKSTSSEKFPNQIINVITQTLDF